MTKHQGTATVTPVISVAMPTRGRPAFVERAIMSVLKQSFSDFEILILDNSSQNDKDKIREVCSRDRRISFVERGNTGVTEARKLGAVLARGNLFSLLDSDDYWASNRLERHMEVWGRNSIGLTWDRWAEAHRNALRVSPQPFEPGLIPPPRLATKLYGWNFIHASSGIVLTSFARTQGFPMLGIMSSDWTLFMRAAEFYPAYFIGETLSFQETVAPDRVSDIESKGFFRKEERLIRRWFLLNRPTTYVLPYAKTKLNLMRRTIKHRDLAWLKTDPDAARRST